MGRSSHLPTSTSSYSSMSSTGRRRSGSSHGFPKKCFCGLDPVMRTSTTADNPGRRFYGCRNYDDGGYHIMKWWDEAMTEEFNLLKTYHDQHGDDIECMSVANAERGKCFDAVRDEINMMKVEIAQLKERLTEKSCGQIKRGVELKSMLFAGAIIIILIIFIRVGFK